MKLTTMAIMLAGALTTASAITPVDKWGRLQAKSGKLYDATGTNQVVLRGMSLYWSSEASGNRFYNPPVVDWLYSDFKASIIRIPVAPTATSTGGKSLNKSTDSAFIMPKVLDVIDECIAQGIYVLVDWHVVDAANASGSSQPQTAFAQKVFGFLAKRYKDVPNVLWEVWNEPTCDNGTVVSHANSVISTIRAAGNKNLIVVGNSGYSSTPDQISSVTDPLSPANVAYTIHFYAGAPAHDGYKSNVSSAITNGRTVFATEFGTTDASGDNGVNTANADSWISFLETNGVSWCNWDVGTQENKTGSTTTQTSSIFLSTGATPFGNWPLTDLGTSGTWVRNKIRASTPNSTFTVRPPPDTTFMPSASDTAYATKYIIKTNIDTAASTDGGSKGIVSSTASGSGQSAQYRVTTTASSSYMAFATRLKGGATGGAVKVSINNQPVDSFKVAAGSAWATIYDSASTQWATIGAGTYLLQLDFTGDVSFHWLVGSTTRFGWKPNAGVIRGGGASLAQHVVAHRVADNLVLVLPAGHDWEQVSIVDAQGKCLANSVIAPKAQQVSLPSGSGLTWVVFDGPSGKQSMAVAPAR